MLRVYHASLLVFDLAAYTRMYVCMRHYVFYFAADTRAHCIVHERARGRLGTRTDANANTHERAARVACQHIKHIKHKHKHHHNYTVSE